MHTQDSPSSNGKRRVFTSESGEQRRVDYCKLQAAMKEVIPEIQGIKKILRTSGQPDVGWSRIASTSGRGSLSIHTYGQLRIMKNRATDLCALRAELRGRLHIHPVTPHGEKIPESEARAQQTIMVKNILPEFLAPIDVVVHNVTVEVAPPPALINVVVSV
jgi:hypothetical protein